MLAVQQKKFTSLDGTADVQGDLKSVVLHDMKIQQVSSNFPVSLGARITGVDDTTFSSTGESFSMIVLPHSNSANEHTLQSDDVSLAYEFAKKVIVCQVYPTACVPVVCVLLTHMAFCVCSSRATRRTTSRRRASMRSTRAASCLWPRIIRLSLRYANCTAAHACVCLLSCIPSCIHSSFPPSADGRVGHADNLDACWKNVVAAWDKSVL